MTERGEAETGGQPNLAAYLLRGSGEATAIIGRNGQYTYDQVRDLVSRWQPHLVDAGVGPGDRVGILTGNSIDFVGVHLATMALGAATVPFNPASPAGELVPQLEVVDPTVVYVGPDTDFLWPSVATVNQDLADRRIGPPPESAPESSYSVAPVEADTPALLMFTSGTAGASKPAILTHRNLASSLQSVISQPVAFIGRPHTLLAVIPLFHVFGINMVLHLGLLLGSTVVLEDYSDPVRTLQLIRTHGATIVAGPPALWQRLIDAGAKASDFATVEMAVSGAAALPAALAVTVSDRLGLILHDGYGLTESSAVGASTLGMDDPPIGSVGHLLPGMEARIVDGDEDDCLVGDPGELWLRGPMISPGYWGESAPHFSRTEDGWLRTGDQAVVDVDGCLAIVGRKKDLIIVSGFNVFPAEVEAAIASHPSVGQVGVVGEPSESTGEAVVAFIVPADAETVEEAEIWAHCEERLARYKIPHRFVIAPSLPLGPTGKLRRNRLLERL